MQEALGAANISFITCSEDVDRVLGPDVMKSVAYLVPDILAHMSLLLYQGDPFHSCSGSIPDLSLCC